MFDPAGSSPIPSPGWAGGHSYSADGFNWSPIQRCYNTSLPLEDGRTVEMKRRERPKLVFDGQQRPTHLFNGGQFGNGDTYTVVAPLNV
jgi:hypothetical protein